MTEQNNQKSIKIILSFIILIYFLPIIYSRQGLTDQFLFEHIAYVRFFLDSSHFPLVSEVFSPKYVPGTFSFYLIFCKITNISPETFQYLPVVGLLLPIAYYAVCKKFTNSMIYSLVFTVFMIHMVPPTNFLTVWTHSWGYFLFLIVILLFTRIFINKSFSVIVSLLILFISIHFYSYTVEMWVIVFSISLNSLLVLMLYINRDESIRRTMSSNISLAFVIICLTFNKIYYDVYLAKGKFIDTFLGSLDTFCYTLILHEKSYKIGEFTYYGESHILMSLLGFICYFLITFLIISVVCITILSFICKNQRFKSIVKLDKSLYFKVSLLCVSIMDIFLYAMGGLLTTRTIVYILPIVALISLEELKIKAIYKQTFMLVLLIAVLSHTYFSLYYEPLPVDYSKYAYIEPSVDWFSSHAGKEALTDLRTGNKYVLDFASKKISFNRILINSTRYGMIVHSSSYNTNKLNYISNYIIINTKIDSVQSMEWGNLKPFSKYLYYIDRNINMHKIYNDDSIYVYNSR